MFRWLFAAFALAVMITVVAVALPIYREHQAARKWEQLGGNIMWSDFADRLKHPHDNSLRRKVQSLFQHVAVADRTRSDHAIRELLPIIVDFRNLHVLWLTQTQVSAEELRQLAVVQPDLKSLGLEMCFVTDDGLREISQLDDLTELRISGAEITDAGLLHLQGLQNLEVLSLVSTEITNEGLWHLRTLKKLRQLDLSNTLITDEGVERLRAEIPSLEVWDD